MTRLKISGRWPRDTEHRLIDTSYTWTRAPPSKIKRLSSSLWGGEWLLTTAIQSHGTNCGRQVSEVLLCRRPWDDPAVIRRANALPAGNDTWLQNEIQASRLKTLRSFMDASSKWPSSRETCSGRSRTLSWGIVDGCRRIWWRRMKAVEYSAYHLGLFTLAGLALYMTSDFNVGPLNIGWTGRGLDVPRDEEIYRTQLPKLETFIEIFSALDEYTTITKMVREMEEKRVSRSLLRLVSNQLSRFENTLQTCSIKQCKHIGKGDLKSADAVSLLRKDCCYSKLLEHALTSLGSMTQYQQLEHKGIWSQSSATFLCWYRTPSYRRWDSQAARFQRAEKQFVLEDRKAVLKDCDGHRYHAKFMGRCKTWDIRARYFRKGPTYRAPFRLRQANLPSHILTAFWSVLAFVTSAIAPVKGSMNPSFVDGRHIKPE